MKLLRALVLCAVFGPPAVLAVESGSPAPDFELPGTRAPVRLSAYQGKVVYLDFWASWCVPCRLSFPFMNEMLAKYEGHGLRVIGINVDRKPADAAKFLERVPARFEIALDPAGSVPRAYEVKAMPSSYLIAADGRVVEVHRGFTNEDRALLERRIRAALDLR